MRGSGIILQFAIGGAFAATLYDEPISTVDLDIFIRMQGAGEQSVLSLSKIYDFAKEQGFRFDHEFINIHGWLVQFVESSHNELWKEAIATARVLSIDETDLPVIDPEHLVAMWLFAGRAKDYNKISMFWASELLDKDKVIDILDRHGLRLKWEKESWRFIDEERL